MNSDPFREDPEWRDMPAANKLRIAAKIAVIALVTALLAMRVDGPTILQHIAAVEILGVGATMILRDES